MDYTLYNDYSLYPDNAEPATEGFLGDIFKRAWEALKEFGNKIRDAINWILDLGKIIKSKIVADREEKHGDPRAEQLVTQITKNINEMSKQMLAALKDKNGNNVSGDAKSLHSAKLRKALELSTETIVDMKELPNCNMSYKMASTAYMSLKALLADNGEMMQAVAAIKEIRKDKDEKLTTENDANLTKFLNVHSKLRACVNALLQYMRKIAPKGEVAKEMDALDKANKGKKHPKSYADMNFNTMQGKINKDISNNNKDVEKVVKNIMKEFVSDPDIKKANGGKKLSADQMEEFLENRLGNTTVSKRLEQLMSNDEAMAAYARSVITKGSLINWIKKNKANESVDTGKMLYESIKESVMEELFNDALSAANEAFADFDTIDTDIDDYDDDNVFDD